MLANLDLKFDMLPFHGSINKIQEIVFDEITKDLIQKTAIKI